MKSYLRVASIMPRISVGNPHKNSEAIKEAMLKANSLGVKLCCLPELSITGNSLQCLYHDQNILNESLKALFSIISLSVELDIVIVVSLPFSFNNRIYNVAAVIKSGNILAMVPKHSFKSYDINKDEFCIPNDEVYKVTLYDKERNLTFQCPFCKNILFSNDKFNFSIVFNENFDSNVYSSIYLNVSSIPETIYVDEKIREIKTVSNKLNSAIITSTQGPSESSVKNAYFGRSLICECGDILTKNDIINNQILLADIDLDRISNYENNNDDNILRINFNFTNYVSNSYPEKLYREFSKTPYINLKVNPYNYSMHIVNIIAVALAKRMNAINASNIVLGLSGGVDSTIALIIAKKATEFLSLTNANIKAYSLPCFGTTEVSNNNAKNLAKALDINLTEINISNIVTLQLNNIEHDIKNTNVTFENAQARERTKILMDIANDNNGIVVGTGDLSEIALGFSTYNGDQMSMYNLNASLPKTLIKYMLNAIAREHINTKDNKLLADTILNILHVPISPELLPTENGLLLQKTEDILGSYEIHDFILYYYLKYHYDVEKLNDLAIRTFVYNSTTHDYTEDYVKNCIKLFFSRFYKAHYKRVAAPDSPDIGLPNLNSSFSFMMPCDCDISI